MSDALALLDRPVLQESHVALLQERLVASVPALTGARVGIAALEDGWHEGEALPPGIIVGRPDAPLRLLLTSGLHGVEGRFGLLLQCAFLAGLAPGDFGPEGQTCVVVLFALNRSGFLGARRWCAANTDLNRAFAPADLDAMHPAWADLYARFRPGATRATGARFLVALARNVLRFGWDDLFEGLPRGQSRYPDFVFHVAPERAVGRRAMEARLTTIAEGARSLLHVDLHTGLGRRGDAAILSPSGPLSASLGTGKKVYTAPGTLVDWGARTFPSCYDGCVLEFGTASALAVFLALVRENHSFYARAEGLDSRHETADALALREAFFPSDPAWRAAALARGTALLGEALARFRT